MSKKIAEEAAKLGIDKTPKTADFDLSEFVTLSAVSWQADCGDHLVGWYDGFKTVEIVKDDGTTDEVKVHFIITHDNSRFSVCGGVLLDKYLEEGDVKTGELVYIKHMGESKTRKGNKMNNWDVRVKRP